MKPILKYFLLSFFILITFISKAQNSSQHLGWFSSVNNFKLSQKTGIYLDVQLRTSDDWGYLRNVLVRPGFTYFFDDKKNATIGYAFLLTNQGEVSDKNLFESRIWEQFMVSVPIVRNVKLTNRIRLEQRFIEQDNGYFFSQRIRYYVRSVIPLKKNEDKFDKGAYLVIQDEIFFNLQGKEKLNNHYLDQNRIYFGTGLRINSKIDIEVAYLNIRIKGNSDYTTNHIAQLSIYNRF